MKLINKIKSFLKFRVKPSFREYNSSKSLDRYDFDLFTQFTQDLITLTKAKYDIDSNFEGGGFFARTDTENQPCFVRKFQTTSGSNLWFYMLYNQETMDITELHIVNTNEGFKSEYDINIVNRFKKSYELKNSLEVALSNTKPTIKKVIKV